jgi:hypothetical protein
LEHDNHPTLRAHTTDTIEAYHVYGPLKTLLAEVKQGIKILHSITLKNHYYFVKESFFKLQYSLFDGRSRIGELRQIKTNAKRFFKITLQEDKDGLLFSLYLLAHPIRHQQIT